MQPMARHRPWHGKILRAGLALLAVMSMLPAARALEPDKPFHDYVRNSWSIEQGLPQISVNAIAQDRDGYLWLGTQSGLARFDGVRFVNYGIDNTPELPGRFVQALLATPDNRLWVGTSRGLAVRENGRFRTLKAADAHGVPLNVAQLARDAGGRILAASAQGTYAVQGDRLVLLSPQPARSLLPRPEGLWVGGDDGALLLESNGTTTRYPLPGTVIGTGVDCLLFAQGWLWAGTGKGLFRLERGRWTAYAGDPWLGTQPVEALQEDRDGNLWVALSENMVRLRDGRVSERITGKHGAVAFRSIFEDREGNLWLGSMLNGATRLWNGWTRRYSVSEGLQNPILWSLAPGPGGTVFAGTNDGVEQWVDGLFHPWIAGARLPHPAAYTLLPDGKDGLWIGTRSGVAYARDGHIVPMPALEPMRHAQISAIVRDGRGHVWFGTTEGLYELDDRTLTRHAEADGLDDPRVRVLAQAADGQLLIGTHAGLYAWREGRAHFLGPGKTPREPYDITAITELPGGQIIVGSLDEEALFLFDGRQWHRCGREQGLPLSAAFHFATAPDGQLWVGGLRGVYRVPIRDLLARARDPQTVLHSEMLLNERGDRHGGQKGDCCNGAGTARGFVRDGTLWLPTRDGIVTLAMDGITRNDIAPTTLIERIRIDDTWQDISSDRPLTLPADARDLGFEFTTLSFQAADHMDIRYRLVGYDKDWRSLEDPDRRVVAYTNLPAGHYVFEVIGGNNSGLVSPRTARLAFDIRPHLHETWAFRAGVLALLLLVAWGGYRVMVLRLRRQRDTLERLVHERTLDLQKANERLREISMTDPLTGLHNRRYLIEQIPADIAYYRRSAATAGRDDAMVFALLDIDHFKAINDSHGHEGGDAVLCRIAQVLRTIIRDGDYLVRWGGEEILLVFRPMPRGDLPALGARICSTIASRPFPLPDGSKVTVTASVGLAECPPFPQRPDLLGWEQLVALADRALYWIKENGRNGWACYRARPETELPDIGKEEATPVALIDAGLLVLRSDRGYAARGMEG